MLWQIVLLSLLGTVGTDADTSCSGLCGQRPLADTTGSRVVGGMNARPGAWPWMVSIQIQYFNGMYRYHICGGSLIAPSWVLTAAHCFFGKGDNLNKWRLLVGGWEFQYGRVSGSLDPNIQERKPVKFILHEYYMNGLKRNDIALVQLDRPIQCGDRVRLACLPRPGDPLVSPETRCSIAGWGYLKEGAKTPSKILQEAEVNVIDTRICNGSRWYFGLIAHTHLCAGYQEGKIAACQGDSGGPLMCKDRNSDTYIVHGITSWSIGCAQAFKPSVYTSTWHFVNWITAKMGPGFALPDRPPVPSNKPTLPPQQKSTYRPSTTRPYFFYVPWWVRPWRGDLPHMWSHSEEPWPPGNSFPLMNTPLQPWISNPAIVKAQVPASSQALPLKLSLPKHLSLLMDDMKNNKSI